MSVPAVLGNRAGGKNEGTDQRSIYLYTRSTVHWKNDKRSGMRGTTAEACRTSVKRAQSFIHSRHSLGPPTKHEIICTFQVRKNRGCRPRQAVVYESHCAYSKPSLCRHRFIILASLKVFHRRTRCAVRKHIRACSEVLLKAESVFSPPGFHCNETFTVRRFATLRGAWLI